MKFTVNFKTPFSDSLIPVFGIISRVDNIIGNRKINNVFTDFKKTKITVDLYNSKTDCENGCIYFSQKTIIFQDVNTPTMGEAFTLLKTDSEFSASVESA